MAPPVTAIARLQPPTQSAGPDVRPAAIPHASPDVQPLPKPAKPGRDHRLDFWRGLCLIDMLFVHLIHQGMSLGESVDLWVGEYTRFAAGGFVFIAGLSIGRIFLPRARDPAKKWATYRALWKRSLVILAVHYVAEIGYLTMWPLFGGVSFQRLRSPIWDILTFKAGYDLLPFYVVMVALAPAMLELLRRRLWWVLAAGSGGAFAWAHATGAWHKHALPIQHDFFPILWQVIFVAGMLGGEALTRYDRLSIRPKIGLAIGLWATQIALFLAYYGPKFGVHFYDYQPFTFTKVPLTTGEALRYLTLILAIMVSTDLVWKRWLAGGGIARFSERLGRNSLSVFVFHVWVVQLVVHAAQHVTDWPGRAAMGVGGLALLWAFAWVLEFSGQEIRKARPDVAALPKPKARPAWRAWAANAMARRRISGLPAMAATTLLTVYLANVIQRQASPRYIGRNHGVPQHATDLLMDRTHADPWETVVDPVDDPLEIEEDRPDGVQVTPDDVPAEEPTSEMPEPVARSVPVAGMAS